MSMKFSVMTVAIALFAALPPVLAQRGTAPKVANPVVVQFMVDGIDANSVRTAVANGAATLGIAAETRGHHRHLLLHEPGAPAGPA